MLISVWVKAGSRGSPRLVADAHDAGSFVAWVREKPIDGKANIAVEELVAQHFGVARADVQIRRGLHSRRKSIWVTPTTPA
ncbi:MAG TPA: DUF167 domain-containing protein [Propionibacteriaceae bacterium]|nr:DUF167 domain-containing protein [Propionibacteriaceae bacterium]